MLMVGKADSRGWSDPVRSLYCPARFYAKHEPPRRQAPRHRPRLGRSAL